MLSVKFRKATLLGPAIETWSLSHSFSNTWYFLPSVAQSLFRLLQYTDWEHLGDGYLNQKKVAEVVGDYFFICPTNLFAEYFAARGTTVYYYYFTQVRLAVHLLVLSAKISENATTFLCKVHYVMIVFHALQLLKFLKEYFERLIEIIFPEENLV